MAMIEIETSEFVRFRGKSKSRSYLYYAIARLDSGLLGTCFSSVPAPRGNHFVRTVDYLSEILKSGKKVETFVAYLD